MPTIFEQIVLGQIPCYKIAENTDFFAFLDIHPRSCGHTLVIPKKPYRWVWDVPNFGDYLEFCKKVSVSIQLALKPDFVSLYTYGTDVPHAHVHLIPKYSNDTEYAPKEISLSAGEFQQIASSILKMLK